MTYTCEDCANAFDGKCMRTDKEVDADYFCEYWLDYRLEEKR